VRNAEIAMSEAKSPEPRVALSAAKQRGKVFIQVADNGPGIPEEIAARLFQPFVTGSKSGTGLGLAMVERLARLNDGHVWVDSKAGVGTLFTVEIMDA